MKRLKHLLLFLFLPLLSFAQQVRLESRSDYTDVFISIDHIEWHYEENDSFPDINASFIYEKGAPELPKIVIPFHFSEERKLDFDIYYQKDSVVSASIMPSQGLPDWENRDRIFPKSKRYEESRFFPSENVQLSEAYMRKSTFGQNLIIYPFQYNPVSKLLSVRTEFRVRVKHPMLRSKAAQLAKSGDQYPESMLILAPDSFLTTLQPFLNWKNRIGIETYVVAADTITGIKSLVEYYYNNYNIDYLLIAGTIDKVGTSSTNYGAGDNNYGYLSGDDPYWDVYVGRLPAFNNKELKLMLEKTISYEKISDNKARAFSYLGIASEETTVGDNGEKDVDHIQAIADNLAHISFDTIVVSPLLEEPQSITASINSGVDLMCYAGHGNEQRLRTYSYDFDSIAQLENNVIHPFFIDVACLNGAFQNGDCVATKMMTAQNKGRGTGALAMVASTISQPWMPPMCGQDEMVNKIVEANLCDTVFSIGEIVDYGLYKMINKYGDGGIETAVTWNLFADPSVKYRSIALDSLPLICDSTYNVRDDVFNVYGLDGSFVSFASKDKVYAKGLINNGKLMLKPGLVPVEDTIIVTASKNGYLTQEKLVTPYYTGGAYYAVDRLLTEEDNEIIEPGKRIVLKPLIKNYGDSCGYHIAVEMTTQNPHCEIINGVLLMDSIPGHDTALFDGTFEMRIDEGVSDLSKIELDLRISDSIGQQNTRTETIVVKAPVLEKGDVWVNEEKVIDDYVFGEDTLIIKQVLMNKGHAPGVVPELRMSCASPYVRISRVNPLSSDLPALSSDTAVYELLVSANIPEGEYLGLDVQLGDQLNSYKLIAYRDKQVQLGEANVAVSEYPFYNYYKNNKSQFLILSEELGGINKIDSLGVYISSYPNSSSYTVLTNFSLSYGSTEATAMSYSYLSTYDHQGAETNIELPRENGWVYFDLRDYTMEGKNLFVEINWGDNYYCTPYNQSYEVMACQTSENSVVYGYSDSQSPPAVRNVSKYRPIFKLIPCQEVMPKSFLVVKDQNGELLLDYSLQLGSMHYLPDDYGTTALEIAQGEYTALVFDNTDTLYKGKIQIAQEGGDVLIESTAVVTQLQQNDEHYLLVNKQRINIGDNVTYPLSIVVYDVSGRRRLQLQLNSENENVTIDHLLPGIYFLKTTSSTHRLVID